MILEMLQSPLHESRERLAKLKRQQAQLEVQGGAHDQMLRIHYQTSLMLSASTNPPTGAMMTASCVS